jgi:hypothetical protein
MNSPANRTVAVGEILKLTLHLVLYLSTLASTCNHNILLVCLNLVGISPS